MERDIAERQARRLAGLDETWQLPASERAQFRKINDALIARIETIEQRARRRTIPRPCLIFRRAAATNWLMKNAAQDSSVEAERGLARKILEAKIDVRVAQLELLAARTWLELVRGRQRPPARD